MGPVVIFEIYLAYAEAIAGTPDQGSEDMK